VVKNSKAESKVAIDRRGQRSERRGAPGDRRAKDIPVAVERRQLERRAKVSRRRQIDPTTCERDYHNDELEFMHALDDYKRTSGRMFPTCSEVLEVLKNLGYQKLQEPAPAAESAMTAAPAIGTAEPAANIPAF
jgi:hypothetical protein